MDLKVFLFVVLFVSAAYSINDDIVNKYYQDVVIQFDANPANADGGPCLICDLSLTLVEDILYEDAQTIDYLIAGLCTLLPTGPEREACEVIIETVGVPAIKTFLKTYNSDYVCHLLGLCDECYLFGNPDDSEAISSRKIGDKNETIMKNFFARLISQTLGAHINPEDVPSSVYPNVDIDGDHFASVEGLHRGTHWRGKDCNDLSKNIHPSVLDSPNGLVDQNCNGIFGVDPDTGDSYESTYCAIDSNSSIRSVVAFGDSAMAAFHIPVEWISLEGLASIPEYALNEFDVPQQSWATGYIESVDGLSLLAKITARNQCNFRDYQNLGVNGATMKSFLEYQVDAMVAPEKPGLMVLGMIGNDVCKRSLSQMTEPSVFQQQFQTGVQNLDKRVVNGTKLITLGLVDGRVLWNTMSNLTHPLGCTYAEFYEFLTCTGNNPCNTWLSPNETQRNLASQRAADLSSTISQSLNNQTFVNSLKNLDLIYIDFAELLDGIVNFFGDNGLNQALLIEQVDGFHPSPLAHRISAAVIWQILESQHPDFIGNINPYNPAIQTIFGDQGGY
eukprot:TRINITY_DN2841_c0_g1_i1.p1 TRINITY_DN2841_c0_g1~~TRINITY_DN2841_c0_g1_i1.p1  ORF type:complete len:560 (+),score=199.81 TRINITY_DN2841_c0_g1_i1:33-1712(+)